MLKVTPEELVVHGPSHCKRRATFYIINDLSKNQVFKIKSTAPERIGVSPNSGFIRAYDRVEVSEVSRFLSDLSNYFLARTTIQYTRRDQAGVISHFARSQRYSGGDFATLKKDGAKIIVTETVGNHEALVHDVAAQ